MGRQLAVALCSTMLLTACETREVEKDLKIVNVHTGWYDAGILEGGQNKLVPSISLELQNVSDRDIESVQMQAVFRRAGEQQAWGDHFVRAIDTNGLPSGSTTKPIILRSPLGYTGGDARLKMLQNREFVDANVTILGKHGRRTWIKMGEYQIDRQLLTE